MSGGSFDYLYARDWRADELPRGDDENLVAMASRVRELLPDHPIVAEMDALVASLTTMHEMLEAAHRQYEKAPKERWERLRPFLKAVEWKCSGDVGMEAVLDEADRITRGER